MDAEQIISRMVQIGTVSVVDSSKHAVRVIFKQSGESSGWLKVLQHIGGALDIVPDAQHTHNITDTYTGGGSASIFPNHNHTGSTTASWMPRVNEDVLVLYLPISNGDGFMLGGI